MLKIASDIDIVSLKKTCQARDLTHNGHKLLQQYHINSTGLNDCVPDRQVSNWRIINDF